MPADAKEGTRTCIALVKDEAQYSPWPADGEIFPGRSAVGRPGTRDECLAFVREVWTGMTPWARGRRPRRAGPPASGHAGPHQAAPERIRSARQART